MESFLKEQLKRIQDLAKQLSSLTTEAAALTHGREHAHATLSYGPLSDVKDLRTHTSMREHHAVREHQTLGEHHARQSRSTADDHSPSPRRRRRRS